MAAYRPLKISVQKHKLVTITWSWPKGRTNTPHLGTKTVVASGSSTYLPTLLQFLNVQSTLVSSSLSFCATLKPHSINNTNKCRSPPHLGTTTALCCCCVWRPGRLRWPDRHTFVAAGGRNTYNLVPPHIQHTYIALSLSSKHVTHIFKTHQMFTFVSLVFP